ncbi:BRO-N domain-containing protein [Geobacillus stearothermophilus]|uniref:BRO-N domain-containing protein n=1 Tax=Geobacillus stearothermophilus TaxID=1422 RepID=UPI00399D02FC
MNHLQQVFNYSGSQVRTIVKDGEVWFVAKDVCEILDIADARKAVQRLDEDERSLIPVTDSLGRKQETFIVNEPGLYTLILGSRKSEAKQFKRWVTHEVIPTIRKTGGYVANDDLFVETYLTSLRKKSPTSKREGAPAPVKVGDEFRLALANE